MLISVKTKVYLIDYKSPWETEWDYLDGCVLSRINFHIPCENENSNTELYSDYLNLKHEKDINKSILNVDNKCSDNCFYSFLCIDGNNLKKEINFLRVKIPFLKNNYALVLGEILKSKNDIFSVSGVVDDYFSIPRHNNFTVEIQLKKKSNEREQKKQTILLCYNKGLLKLSITNHSSFDKSETLYKEKKVIINSKNIFKSLPHLLDEFIDDSLIVSNSRGVKSFDKKLSISI